MVNTKVDSHKVVCGHCRKEYNIMADRNDMEAWLSGEKYIQDALSYLSASERELLISATCNTCWKTIYGLDDEE
jgi:predicted anti-sigma-YlaC factor YlaD